MTKSTNSTNSKNSKNKKKDLDKALRYINMLSLVPLEPDSISTEAIQLKLESLGHEVDRRTVQRDLVKLSVADFPLDTRAGSGREQLWFFRKGSPTQWPAMSVDTALTLLLAEQNLKPLLPQQVLGSFASIVNQAHVTLDLQDRTGNRQIWADSVRIVPKGFVLQQPEITSGVMETVYNAMGKQRQLQITKDGKESVINPLGLVMRGPVIYLVCNYHGYDNIRITALHRIESATVQMTDLVIPKDFNLDETLQKGIMSWQLEPGQSQHFVIEVNAFIARYLDENRINATQEISLHTDGSAQVAFTAEDTLVLRQWLLGFGAEIEVKKPVAVRKWIGDVIKKMAGVYGE